MSHAALVSELEGIALSGVTVLAGGQPATLKGVTLPAMWVHPPRGLEEQAVAGAAGGEERLSANVVVAIQAVRRNRPRLTEDAEAVLDALQSAYAGRSWTTVGDVTWKMRVGRVYVAHRAFWAVLAQVGTLD